MGTGALICEQAAVGRLVRMSVDQGHRRQGIGTLLLEYLLEHARARGYRQLVLETTQTWEEVITFYRRNGFNEVARRHGDAHFVRSLEDAKA